MSTLKVNELDTKTGTTITVAAGKTLAGTDIIGSTQIAANAVTTTEIIDNAVTGAKIAMGSDATGDLLYYNGTDYVRLAAGTSAQVLTSAGVAAPTWSAAGVGDGDVTVAKLSTSVTEADNVKQRVCKAWMTFNTSSGTPAILDDFNFSSITDEAVGHFTVNFSTAMGNANYSALATTRHADGVTMAVCPTIDNRTTTGYKVWTVTAGAVAFDPVTDGVSTIVFGDSA